jgi:hypothetical protein
MNVVGTELIEEFCKRIEKAAYGSAMAMVRRLAVVPALNEGQTRYLDALCVLVAAYEKMHRTVGKAKLKPLDSVSPRPFLSHKRIHPAFRSLSSKVLGSAMPKLSSSIRAANKWCL